MKGSFQRYFILLFFVVFSGISSAFGGIIISGPAPGNHVSQLVIPPDGDTITLNPDPVTYLAAATSSIKAALTAEFPVWNFTYSSGLSGTLNINEYKATSAGAHNGGGLLDATYTRAASDPLIADLFWIQMVVTNVPLGGGSVTGYIDPRPNDDSLPFYPDVDYNKTATTFSFFDTSRRSCGSHPGFITWRGELMLASWDGSDPGNVTVYDGIRWGWDLKCVPEPTSVVLWVMGGVGIAIRRAGQRRNSASGAQDRSDSILEKDNFCGASVGS
jgi:hypothetical protein